MSEKKPGRLITLAELEDEERGVPSAFDTTAIIDYVDNGRKLPTRKGSGARA